MYCALGQNGDAIIPPDEDWPGVDLTLIYNTEPTGGGPAPAPTVVPPSITYPGGGGPLVTTVAPVNTSTAPRTASSTPLPWWMVPLFLIGLIGVARGGRRR